MGRTACTEPQCLYKGALYLYLFYFALDYVLLIDELFSAPVLRSERNFAYLYRAHSICDLRGVMGEKKRLFMPLLSIFYQWCFTEP
jgi:hypothetical protein